VEEGAAIRLDEEVALRTYKNELLAVMTLEQIRPWNLEETARLAFGTTDPRHSLVAEMYRWGRLNISGELQIVQLPKHCDFQRLRLTPLKRGRCWTELAGRTWWHFRREVLAKIW